MDSSGWDAQTHCLGGLETFLFQGGCPARVPFKPDIRTRGGSATPAGSLPLGASLQVARKPLGPERGAGPPAPPGQACCSEPRALRSSSGALGC